MNTDVNIKDKIYEINGKKVMFDFDIAKLCGIETKRINETIRRNKEKFLMDEVWKITDDQKDEIIFSKKEKFATANVFSATAKSRVNPTVIALNSISELLGVLKIKYEVKEKILEELNEYDLGTKIELMPVNKGKIEDKIYEIDGIQVMFDFDLAALYKCKNGTKDINRAVKNNPNKFPIRFSWTLSDEAVQDLRLKVLTANLNTKSRYNPRVFTEQGVAMLATILKSDVAVQTSINIMDAFVSMRKYISNNLIEQKYINDLVIKDSRRIDVLENIFSNFKETTNEIFYEGQIYDAYSKIIDILCKAKEEIIIVDAYSDKTTLDIISKLNCKVKLICKKNGPLKEIDIRKYKEQYNNLSIYYSNAFHDRYFLLDKSILYHCGTSLNNAGCKTFSINKIEDEDIINNFAYKVKCIVHS